MTPQAERRRAMARDIVAELAVRTGLRAALLAGSAGVGTSDDHSDIDLLTYFDGELPDVAAFDAVLGGFGAVPAGLIGPAGPDGFAARYQLDGIEVQTGPSPVAMMEARLLRIELGDVDWITAKVAMGLLEGLPLHGEKLIRTWQRRAAYPDALRRREVEENMGFFQIWRVEGQLAARDAELFRRQMLLDGAFRIAAVLSAVNRMYFSTFQFKRAGEHFAQMSLKPSRLSERLDFVANGPPSQAAEELHKLVEETRAIVRSEMPDVEIDVPWRPPVEP